jgi:hypothetical protein
LELDNRRFYWGFWQKLCAERGFSMVNPWWIAGESWYVDGHFSGSKNFHFSRIYFSGIPILALPTSPLRKLAATSVVFAEGFANR